MALRGTLGDFSITDILQLIALQRKSGRLVLRQDGDEIALGFEDGKIVTADASTRSVEHRVGSLLVRTGKLTEDRLAAALEIQKKTLKRLGHVLVDKNWVRHEAIQAQLTLQMSETVYELFRWRTGEYDFQPDVDIDWDREFVRPLPCEHLLMEGARMIDEWPMIERTIRDFTLVLRPTPDLAPLLASSGAAGEESGSIFDDDIQFDLIPSDPLGAKKGGPKLSPNEQRVLPWIDGMRNVAEVAELSELGTFEAMKTLAGMVDRRLLEPVEEEIPETKVRSRPALASAGPARVVMVVALVLALVGAVSTLREVGGVLWPGAPELPMPRPYTTSAWMTQQAGVNDLRTAVSGARLARISRVVQAFELDRSRWPVTLTELVDDDLLPRSLLRDPWGRSYDYQWSDQGYRIAEAGPIDGRPPRSIERALRAGRPGPLASR